ncbi:cold shock domain-containing protein [Neiella sp. HB171785]|uniref:Cold shock domain-containing protein n=1 Tax=Neiella litorisoli TaxID=2771431 RepID=A0A8J6QU50_9GAMM|nr:cold shock domain-containing protein [Neiella litorisoli]MBD1389452.1 cold shock domain-containing protein [Neiella litorisoli]
MTQLTGTVRRIWHDRGYGFISVNGQDQDVFFHQHQCGFFGSLHPSELVKFIVRKSRKGLEAVDVQRVSLAGRERVIVPLKEFVMTRSETPRYGEVAKRTAWQSGWYRDPQQARDELKAKAEELGYNAVLNLTCQRKPKHVGGNYFITVHQFTGDLAVVGQRQWVSKVRAAICRKACEPAEPVAEVNTASVEGASPSAITAICCVAFVGMAVVAALAGA